MRHRRNSSQAFSLFSFQDIITCVTGILILMTLMLSLVVVSSASQGDDGDDEVDIQSTVAQREQLEMEIALAKDRVSKLRRAVEGLKTQVRDSGPSEGTTFVTPDSARENRTLLDQSKRLLREIEQLIDERESLQREATSEDEETQLNKIIDKKAQTEVRLQQVRTRIAELNELKRLIFNPTVPPGKNAWLVEVAKAGVTVARVRRKEPPTSFLSTARFTTWVTKECSASRDYFVFVVHSDGVGAFNKIKLRLKILGYEWGTELLPDGAVAIDPEVGAGI